jgi:diacylglycerol kinase family enzyme
MTDGQFEVYSFEIPHRAALLAVAARAVIGRIPGGRVTRARAARVLIESSGTVPYQIDGDVAGTTPVNMRVEARSVPLLVPEGFVV